jgi:hypothetical protein
MKWFIGQHGDDLERYLFTVAWGPQLHGYQKTWSIFIGRASYSSAADLIDKKTKEYIDKDDERRLKRDKFAQYHYTALESFAALSDLRAPKIEILDNQAHFDLINFIILHYAHCGRIAESLDNCLTVLIGKERQSQNKFKGALEIIKGGRNIIIHGPHPPVYINPEGEVFFIPPESPSDKDSDVWRDKDSRWSDFANVEYFTNLLEYHIARIKEISARMNVCFNELYEVAKEFMRKNKIIIASPSRYNIDTFYGRSGVYHVPEDDIPSQFYSG